MCFLGQVRDGVHHDDGGDDVLKLEKTHFSLLKEDLWPEQFYTSLIQQAGVKKS